LNKENNLDLFKLKHNPKIIMISILKLLDLRIK